MSLNSPYILTKFLRSFPFSACLGTYSRSSGSISPISSVAPFPLWSPAATHSLMSSTHRGTMVSSATVKPSADAVKQNTDLFLSPNGTVIKAQIGSTVVMNCFVALAKEDLAAPVSFVKSK